MIKWLLRIVLGLVLLMVALVGGAILLIDPNSFKSDIEALLSEITGAPVRLDNDLSLDPGLVPRVTVEGIRIDNTDWAGDRPFLAVERFSARVDLVRLLFHDQLRIEGVEIEGMQLHLATRADGPSNWIELMGGEAAAETAQDRIAETSAEDVAQALEADETGDAPIDIAIDQITLTDSRITFDRRPQQEIFSLALSHLDLTAGVDAPMSIALEAALDVRRPDAGRSLVEPIPLTLDGSLPPLMALLRRGQGTGEVDVSFSTGVFEAEVTATLALATLNPVHASMDMQLANLRRFARLIGIPALPDLRASFHMETTADEGGRSVDGDLRIASNETDESFGGSVTGRIAPEPDLSIALDPIDVQRVSALLAPAAEQVAAEEAETPHTPGPGRVIPDVDFPVFLLGLDPGRLVITTPEVLLEGVPPIVDLSVTLLVEPERVGIAPVTATILDSPITLSAAMTGTAEAPGFSLSSDIQDFPYGALLRSMGVTDLIQGRVSVVGDVSGPGANLRGWLDRAEGEIAVAAGAGQVDISTLDGMTRGLLTAIAPIGTYNNVILVNCIALPIRVGGGQARSDGLILDTSALNITGHTSTVFSTEALDGELEHTPTPPTLALPIAIDLGGTLGAPSYQVRAANLDRLAGSILRAPLPLAEFALGDLGSNDQVASCRASHRARAEAVENDGLVIDPDAVAERLGNAGGALTDVLQGWSRSGGEALGGAAEALGNAGRSAGEAAGNAVEGIGGALQGLGSGAGRGLDRLLGDD